MDSARNLYVFEAENHRVSKFDRNGTFLLMFGGEVNKTTGGNVCTAASGNVCGIGVVGSGPGSFAENLFGNFVAVSPSNTVWVGDKDRIESFDPTGTFITSIPTPAPGKSGSLAADPSTGNLYFAFAQPVVGSISNVFRLNPTTGGVLATFPVERPTTITVNSEGDLYAVDDPSGFGPPAVEPFIRGFHSDGTEFLDVSQEFGRSPERSTSILGLAFSSACNVSEDSLYASYFTNGVKSYVKAYAEHPEDNVNCPAPLIPPSIEDQYAVSVGSDTASLRASINSHFWPDTRYYVEYGTGKCSEGGCQKQPAPPGALLTSKIVDAQLTTSTILIAGLQPDTKYHYRFVSESGGGGPTLGEELTFRTFPPRSSPPSPDLCSNSEYRVGSSALLPDCRAYEMVSPVDKNGGDINVLNGPNYLAELNQSSTDGEKISYSSQTAFGDAVSAPFTSQYIASRVAGTGWLTHAIAPPRATASVISPQAARFDVQFKDFTDDLCSGWLLQDTNPPLAPGGVADTLNLYRRGNCGEDSYTAITIKEPQLTPLSLFWPEVQGTSADGSHTVFRANAKLAIDEGPAAANTNVQQLYEYVAGKLRLVSVLPNGEANTSPSSVGSASPAIQEGRANSVWHAVSVDGSRIFWSANGSGAGALYVRIDGVKTTAISAGVAARFWGAAANGSRVLFTPTGGPDAGTLYESAIDGEGNLTTTTPIATEMRGVLGMSDDATSVYFVSNQEIGGEGEAGKANLYLYEVGAPGTATFIATLSSADGSLVTETGKIPSPINVEPIKRSSRVSPDGRHAAFMSTASLTGYDNRDAVNGQADAEVFVYDADTGTLSCVSCNPSGARPSSRDIIVSEEDEFFAAARIPTWTNQFHASRILSDDGSRLFFESFEALVPRDTNERGDVYEWHPATTADDCTALGAELFAEESNGCLSLISSGDSPLDSLLVDASANGRDVFFKTGSSLLPQDPGQLDIYDARAGGGMPVPPPPAEECEGDACQHPASAPDAASPSSFYSVGPNDPIPTRRKRPPCAKGKHRAKGKKRRCVKNGKHHHQHRPSRRSAR